MIEGKKKKRKRRRRDVTKSEHGLYPQLVRLANKYRK